MGVPESSGQPNNNSLTSVRVQSLPLAGRAVEKQEHLPEALRNFTPSPSRDGIGRSVRLDHSRPVTVHPSATMTSISESRALTQHQESKIKSCLTSLEELLRESQLRFDSRNILRHAAMIREEAGGSSQLVDRVGEGLFIVDAGSVDLLSPSSSPSKEVPVIRLSEGDYWGVYSTLFNVPFRTKVQFQSR